MALLTGQDRMLHEKATELNCLSQNPGSLLSNYVPSERVTSRQSLALEPNPPSLQSELCHLVAV